ncbi:MAG: L-serine ammonia-lyase, iron-sulfur-dependent subunit beta [Cyclobacteriaceae bacterium]|nr:L-serine ammonia-lyase, iron-sulfur-dependent subunit beta [Cyclobacteriaceae bacterium]
MGDKSGVFDMIGPIMIGPSSSHTAGVVKIGKAAVGMLGGVPQKAEITFYNSFARTYEGHGSDRAIVAGLLNFNTDDARIKNSFDVAKEQGLEYKFRSVGNASTFHPNTISLKVSNENRECHLIGESKGGGVINIAEIDGFRADFSTSLITLLIKAHDVKGSISFIANVLSQDNCNIATMSVSRKGKNDLACQVIEMDSPMKPTTIDYINSLDWVIETVYLPALE